MSVLWGIQTGVTFLEMVGVYVLLSFWDPLWGKPRKEKVISAVGILLITGITVLQRIDCLYSRFFIILSILLEYAFCIFVFQISKLRLLCIIAIYFDTIAWFDLFGLTLLGMISGNVGRVPFINLNMSSERMAIFLVSRGIVAALLWGMAKYKERIQLWESGIGKAFYAIPLIEHGTLFLCGIVVVPQRGQEAVRNWLLLLCLDFLFLIGLVLCYLRWARKQVSETAEQERKMYRESRETEKKEYEKKDRYYHDMKHHVLAMELYLKNGDLDGLQGYMERLTGPLSETQREKRCGDVILDAVIGEKEETARNHGIRVESSISGVVRQENMGLLMDLCSVIGNLWDNAIEGCERTERNRWIAFYLQQKGSMFFIEMKNSCLGEAEMSAKRTSKKETWKHGIGLESIRSVVRKYHGTCEWKCEEETFEISLSMFIERSNG